MDDLLKDDFILYGIGGLAALIALYFLFSSSAVSSVVNAASTVSQGVATTVNNAATQGTITNLLVEAALGPIGSAWQISNTLNKADAQLSNLVGSFQAQGPS